LEPRVASTLGEQPTGLLNPERVKTAQAQRFQRCPASLMPFPQGCRYAPTTELKN
jgi:hypothetical protein